MAQRPSQYDAVMDKLPVDERYNLLLQGRCTKLVEVLGGAGKRQAAQEGSQGAAEMRREFGSLFELMKEMTGKSIRCSGKTFSTLVDAASLSRDMSVMHDCLMLARKNGVCRAFSRDVQAISLPPRDKRALQGKCMRHARRPASLESPRPHRQCLITRLVLVLVRQA